MRILSKSANLLDSSYNDVENPWCVSSYDETGRIKIYVHSSGYHVDHLLLTEREGNLACKSWKL